MRLRDQRDLEQAVAHLAAVDPAVMGAMAARVGQVALRQSPFGFAGLAAVVIGQQVSTASAAAISGRLSAALQPLTAQALLDADPTTLRNCGLSAAKIRCLQAAATAVQDERLDFDRLAELPVAAGEVLLTSIPGIGPWTAAAFLLFGLGHADAFPAGDLALQEALRLLRHQPIRPGFRELERLAETWRPYRGAAAHVLWAYYRAVRLESRGLRPLDVPRRRGSNAPAAGI